jgi:hypothetical protein
MIDRNHILRFLIILFVAIGCSSGPEEESNNPPEFTERTPTSTADQIPTSTPVEDNLDDPEEPEIEPEPEEEPEPETEEEPEPDPEPEEEGEEEDEEDEEDIVNTIPIRFQHPCFSYLDCPNHEACNIISSTCYSCTESWQCNNQYDIKRTRPSFCCTQEAFDEERCDLIGTCKE